MTDTPLIIIGAGRSGTNLLRDCLTTLPGLGTWPCDEINYIWRHGNRDFPSDEFSPDLARADVKASIHSQFTKAHHKYTSSQLVEKTCANSLRVGFVDRIFPEARYLFIVRDGRDVVLSAMKRWTAPLDLPYILRKARFVPLADLPFYGRRYLQNRFQRLLSAEKRIPQWGPRYEGMDHDVHTKSLPVVCAWQWQRCVDKAREELAQIDSSRVFRLYYEDFVQEPGRMMEQIAGFLGVEAGKKKIKRAVQGVKSTAIRGWRKEENREVLEEISPIIEETLVKHGY